MNLICSCLIPSRKRTEKLCRAIDSIHATSHPDDVEVLVRFDDDDAESLALKPDLLRRGVSVIVGPRLAGYASHGQFYTELAKAARGRWVACFNDDTTIEGDGWARQLGHLRETGLIVQPEFSWINLSMYPRAEGQCVPIVPNLCWERFGHKTIGVPTDVWLDNMLRKDNGWETHFLEGVSIRHDWDEKDSGALTHKP
jgi:hypothetical protein